MSVMPDPSESALTPNWHVRAYRSGDEQQLSTLFGRVFGRPISAEHWRWKLKGQNSPIENVYLAEHGGRAIFQYAGIGTRFWMEGRETTVMVSVDTMTAPEFRRQGLLSAVGAQSYAAWAAAGVPLVLGLPNEQWGSRTTALGWQRLFALRWHSLSLRPERSLARRLGLPMLNHVPLGALGSATWGQLGPREANLHISEVTTAGPAFDQIWAAGRDSAAFSVVRDQAWVQWRYFDCPSRRYRLLLAERAGQPVGYAAFTLVEQHALLAEIYAPGQGPGCIAELGRAAARAAYDAGASSIASLAVPTSSLAATLSAIGLRPRQGAFAVMIVPLAADLPLGSLADPRNWSIAGADFDVV